MQCGQAESGSFCSVKYLYFFEVYFTENSALISCNFNHEFDLLGQVMSAEMNKDISSEVISERLASIRERYGELLDLQQVADFYRYPSVQAVRKAHQRGTLPVTLHRFPRKAGFFAKAEDVASSIEQMISTQNSQCLNESH